MVPYSVPPEQPIDYKQTVCRVCGKIVHHLRQRCTKCAEGLRTEAPAGSINLHPNDIQGTLPKGTPPRPAPRRYISKAIKQAVIERDQNVCQLCGLSAMSGDPLVLDHIVPFAYGGEDTVDNLQQAHRSCNQSRGGMLSRFR